MANCCFCIGSDDDDEHDTTFGNIVNISRPYNAQGGYTPRESSNNTTTASRDNTSRNSVAVPSKSKQIYIFNTSNANTNKRYPYDEVLHASINEYYLPLLRCCYTLSIYYSLIHLFTILPCLYK
jgi:hypothetical protein